MKSDIKDAVKIFILVFLLFTVSCGGGNNTENTPAVNQPIRFHCANNTDCPEILIALDPHATVGALPLSFRGYGDPSLTYDSSTSTLWLAYSWLDILDNAGLPTHLNLGVRTHLAKSTDGGNTFEYVVNINDTESIFHPDTVVAGWLIKEVPTLVQQADSNWQAVWLQYFSPVSALPGVQTDRSGFLFSQTIAASPDQLGLSDDVNASGNTTSRSFGSFFNLNDLSELANCSAFTEPSLFVFDNETYLIAQCIVIVGSVREPQSERLFLLKQQGDTYTYMAQLTDYVDAQQFNADVLTQPNVAFAQDGSVLFIFTPKVLGADPAHQGCIASYFSDFTNGQLARNGNGTLIERAVITADGNGLGPGLCTYDPNSNTGVLLVITTVSAGDVEFSLRATGVHP